MAQKTVSTIWIKAPQTSEAEFDAHLKALDPSHISYANYQLAKHRDFARSFQLKAKLLFAQELYLSGKGHRALKRFKQITDQALSADWGKEDRRILLYSFLRQAQSEEDLEKRKALLLSANRFA